MLTYKYASQYIQYCELVSKCKRVSNLFSSMISLATCKVKKAQYAAICKACKYVYNIAQRCIATLNKLVQGFSSFNNQIDLDLRGKTANEWWTLHFVDVVSQFLTDTKIDVSTVTTLHNT